MKSTETETNNGAESDNWLSVSKSDISKRDISGLKYNGFGTKNNPYKITCCEGLQNIANDLNANYQLIQNIDCSNTKYWNNGMGFKPIGNSNENGFKGTFNGNKFNITGLYINRPNTNQVGLFGEVHSRSSIISNVGLKDIDITGNDFVAGLVGLNNFGNIFNTYAVGKIHANRNAAGVLVGQNNGIISNSHTTGQVSGNDYVGGLVGSNYKTIANSYSTSSVKGIRGIIAGGLVGSNWAIIYNTFSSGRILSRGGGLVGYSGPKGETFNSYWDTEASHQSKSAGGTGKSSIEMKQRSTYQGWNFYEIWQIKNSISYPVLRKTPFVISITHISSPQKVKTFITITLTASDAGFSGRIFFESARGKMWPSYINMVNSVWTGTVLLYSLGKDNHLSIRWYNNEDNCSGMSVSNIFDVDDHNNQIPNSAILIGKVTDDLQKPIDNAIVQLYSDDPKDRDVLLTNFTITDNEGNYKFQEIIPETFFLKIQKPGYQTSLQTINTAADMTITGNAVLHRGCAVAENKKDLVPVLLIPGIMGSKSKGIIYPHLPKTTPAWNEGKLKIHDPSIHIFGWNIWFVGWGKLKKELKKHGYVEGCTLFEVPYDWTLSIENIRDQFLIPWIKHATRTKPKVDIIAHSMGGLIARSYIQSDQYTGDVRKLAMVGTPNKGADVAYYVWEGGDPIKADKSSRDSLYIFTNTLFYLNRDRYSKEICSFNLFGKTPTACNEIEIYNFVHKSMHSIGQLMPIYDQALLDYQTKISILLKREENTFLKALNNLDCLNPVGCFNLCGQFYVFNSPAAVFSHSKSESKVETKLFVGINKKTLNSIFVKPQSSSYSGELYKDGEPKLKPTYVTSGDETVLDDSVIFNDYFPQGQGLTVVKETGKHSGLIRKFAKKILEFITDEQHSHSDTIKNSHMTEPVLIIAIDGRVQPVITGPENIEITQKDFELDYAALTVNNLVDGNYTVTLMSTYNEDYEISVTYVDDVHKTFVENRVRGFYDSTLTTFTFSLNLQSTNDTIQFDRTFSTPIDLQMQNGTDLQMQLTWQDPIGELYQDVEYYSIYWKRKYDAYFQFLDHVVNETSYQTDHAWIDAIKSVYVVKAQLKGDNSSTFFSPPTWIRSNSASFRMSAPLRNTNVKGLQNRRQLKMVEERKSSDMAGIFSKHSSSPFNFKLSSWTTSSATSLINPFSVISYVIRSCLNDAFTLFTSPVAESLKLKEIDLNDLSLTNVTSSYQISSNNKDILSQSTKNQSFLSVYYREKEPYSDGMPIRFLKPFENLHANIMLGHMFLHWVNGIFQWIPEKLSNSIEKINERYSIEKTNKRKVTGPENINNFLLQLAKLNETLLQTEQRVDYLIKAVGKQSINWVVWGLEDYKSDIMKLEDKFKTDQVDINEVLELKEDINYFVEKVNKKYKQTIQMSICHDDNRLCIENVYEIKASASEKNMENIFISKGTFHGLLPDFSKETTILKQNINNITFKYARTIA